MYVCAHQWWKYRLVAGKIDFNDQPLQQALSCCPTTDLTYANPKGTMGLGLKTFKIIFPYRRSTVCALLRDICFYSNTYIMESIAVSVSK